MSLRQLVEAVKQPAGWFKARKEKPDPRPVEAPLQMVRPVSSLEDLRKMMQVISKEAAEQGLESFEEFYDFGEDSEFEDIPAPAQVKFEAVCAARDRDFESEVIQAKEAYRKKLNEEARAELLKELKAKEKPDVDVDLAK